jgi:hypothetical protein
MRPLFLLLAAALSVNAADWPQWRGPLRNGIAPDSPKLLDKMPAEGLKQLWESEEIPTNDEGGLSSPVVAGGRVFVGLVWHRDVPSETRQIGELVLRQLGHQSTKALGDALVEKIEKTRESLPPTLRGICGQIRGGEFRQETEAALWRLALEAFCKGEARAAARGDGGARQEQGASFFQ